MATLSDLITAITARITAAQQSNGPLAAGAAAVVLREDRHDLQTEINKSIGQIGMLVLVGMPHAENKAASATDRLQLIVQTAVAIGEHPILWRKTNANGSIRPFSPAVAQTVAELVQNLNVPGFQRLRVTRIDYIPDAKRQLYEVGIETMLLCKLPPPPNAADTTWTADSTIVTADAD